MGDVGDMIVVGVLLGLAATLLAAAWATAGPPLVACDGEGCTNRVPADEGCEHGRHLCDGCYYTTTGCPPCVAAREAEDLWNGVRW